MPLTPKKILIVDEPRFSRICSAILEQEGFRTESVNAVTNLDSRKFNLVITSYPYGAGLFSLLKETNINSIIISDHMSRELMMMLENPGKVRTHCMIKPIDYHQFRSLVRRMMTEQDAQAAS